MQNIKILSISAILFFSLASINAHAVKRSLCVFDIIGASGDIFNIMKDYKTAALDWGVELELKPYTDEKIAAEDLKAGQCDASVMMGLRSRQFNQYAGSINALGAVPSYEHMKTVIQVLASNNASINEKMKSETYEIAGIIPMGAAYLFVKDRSIDTVQELSGKTIAVMEYDPAQAIMSKRVGMSPVPSDITNFSGRFNNNSVDIAPAPIMTYSALELYKGMKPNGGIVRYNILHLSSQIVLRNNRFPAGFANQSRTYIASIFDRAMRNIDNAYAEVNPKWWIPIPKVDSLGYDEMLREARIDLRGQGIYNADMMTLLRKIRCKHDAARSECSNPSE